MTAHEYYLNFAFSFSLSFRFTHTKKSNLCDDRWRAKCNEKREASFWWYLMLLFLNDEKEDGIFFSEAVNLREISFV